MTKDKKKGFWYKFGIQAAILLVLFIIAEVALRVAGMQAGCLIDDFKIEENPVYQPRFVSDEVGINHIHSEPGLLMKGTVINEQGFRSRIAFTPQSVDSVKKTGKKVIMLIGDSYVEGCCADDVRNSFGDVINRDKHYEILNFGVAGTDIVQYKLVAQKYAAKLKPDRVVICFYMGNDIMYCDRVPTPGVPITYPFKNNKWIYSVPIDHLSRKRNYVFKNAEEAYGFYIDHYTLSGKTRNLFEKTIRYSVILSKIYLLAEHRYARYTWEKENKSLHVDVNALNNGHLKQIANACDSAKVPYVFVAIPMPTEASLGKVLKEKYKDLFGDIKWYVPENLNLEDYDGKNIANHFNNKGHLKYSEFVKEVLQKEEQGLNK